MKKSKMLFSFLFVLVFIFQLMGGMAFAAPEEGMAVEDNILLSYRLSLRTVNADDTVELSEIPGESEDALLGGLCAVTVGEENLTRTAATVSLKSVVDGNDLSVNPPEGYYVSALCLRAEGDTGEAVELLPRALADADSADICLPSSALTLEDEDGVYFDKSAITGSAEEQSYVLDVELSAIDESAVITVTVDGEALDADPMTSPAAIVPENPALVRFDGWLLSYENGSSVIVAADTPISPYASCTLEPVFGDVVYNVSVKAKDAAVEEGGTPELAADVSAPDGVTADSFTFSVTDAEGSPVDIASAPVGSYNISVSSAKVYLNGEELAPKNLTLSFVPGVLTVSQSRQSDVSGTETETEPIELIVTANDPVYDEVSKTYRANGYTDTGLEDGDTVASVDFSIEEVDGMIVCTPTSVVIVDKDGNPVSFHVETGAAFENGSEGGGSYKYNVFLVDAGVAPVTGSDPDRGTLTIKARDRAETYDGSTITANAYDLTGTLAAGDTIDVSYGGGSANVTASPVESMPTAVIKDDTGADVTSQYAITYQPGNVTVTRRDATVTVTDKEITYSGTAFSLSGSDVTFSGLVSGHKPVASWHAEQNGETVAQAITVGQYKICLDNVVIKDADGSGSDVSSNYNLVVNSGTLTIKNNASAIPLTITAKSQAWTYDGKAHTLNEYDVSGLQDGDKLVNVKFKSSSTITNAGEVNNVIESYVIQDSSGAAVPSTKYSVAVVAGKLTVNKFALTLTAESASKVYDGKSLQNNNVVATSLASSSHKLSVGLTVTDANGNTIRNGPVNVGTYTKKISSYKVMDGDIDVTANYDVKTVDGTLKITASGSSNSNGVATGDQSRIGLWIGLLAASAVIILAVIVLVIVKSRKKSGPAGDDGQTDEAPEDVDKH